MTAGEPSPYPFDTTEVLLRARTRALAALLAAGALALAGCGSSSSNGSSPDATSTATAPVTAPGAVTPVDWTKDVPEVSGSYGEKPTLTFPSDSPPTDLSRAVLHEGDGATVQKGELLAADYLGQIWGGKVFDNSYDRGQPAAFGIGVGQVVPGWDNTLVGMKVGSRVLISLPPDQGYGAEGNANAGITGTDTLVFVVDIVGAFPPDKGGQADATPAGSAPEGITVTGQLGAEPQVKVAAGTPEPKKVVTTVLARGSGEKLPAGLAVLQYVAVDWKDTPVESTWDSVPAGLALTPGDASNPFGSLLGVPVGSRVLLQLPLGSGGGPYAVVADVVAHVPTAAQAARG